MSTTPHYTRLAEQLDQLKLSQAELARRSRTSVTTIARARGEKINAEGGAHPGGAQCTPDGGAAT